MKYVLISSVVNTMRETLIIFIADCHNEGSLSIYSLSVLSFWVPTELKKSQYFSQNRTSKIACIVGIS